MNGDQSRIAKVAQFRLTPRVAEERIRTISRDTGNVIFGDHILDRMEERGITDIQVLEILHTGMVFEPPELTECNEWKCKIVKELRARRDAGVIVVILTNRKLFLKTVEWEDLK